MFVYSAHEINIAYTLLALDAYKIHSIPNYGSYVLFEVHRINGVWGLKVWFAQKFFTDENLSSLKDYKLFTYTID